MSSEKRMFLTLLLCVVSVWGLNELLVRTGMVPRPIDRPNVAKGDPAKGKGKEADKLAGAEKPPREKGDLPENVFAPNAEPPKIELVEKPGPKRAKESDLVLGSDSDESPAAYHLRLQLDQRGAVVREATSARYDAEFDPSLPKNVGRNPRLKLIDTDLTSSAPGSLALTVISTAKAPRPLNADGDEPAVEPPKVEAVLDGTIWEVVREKDDAPAVHPVTKTDATTNAKVEGQEVVFRYTADDPAVTVTKVYRIWKGEDGFDFELRFSSPSKDSKFSYKLYGPHGIPIEGEWYTSTFRDVFFDQVGAKDISTRASTEVVKYKGDPSYRNSTLPLKYAGVEDQYFATFLQPSPIPKTQEERWDMDSAPVVFVEDTKAPQKSDVGIEINSKPIQVGPNLGEIVHKYRVFAGPKLAAALLPYEADGLSSYRKNQWFSIPLSGSLAKYVIAPMLEKIYALTQSVARLFGRQNGNYGIAIILLTMTVRMIMFPLGRKQAMMAKKMQDLQPVLAEVKEKFKDDKEAMTRETMAVWKQHKINPMAGCVPALIQMPIFVGLWQTLNNSVALRHSSFLWIRDLAAPDMLFKFPTTLPWIGDYFNLLPFVVVALMLVQTKLFSPPPTTPEAEMNQKMMKYFMVVMAFMFYKVPSGLGIYFITSSLWQISERLLLPKVMANPAKAAIDGGQADDPGKGPGPNGKGPRNPGPNGNGDGPQGWLGKRLEKLLEEAAKDKTIRNNDREPAQRDRGRERESERDRNRPRPRPGKRR